MRNAVEVPAFALFGDAYRAREFAFLHAEKLEIRSANSGWRIPLHVHPDFDQASILLTGQCAYEHDGITRTISAPSSVFTSAGCVHQFAYEPRSDGVVISLSRDVIDGFGPFNAAVPTAYGRLTASRAVAIRSERAQNAVAKYADLLCDHTSMYHPHRFDSMRYLLAQILLELDVFAVQEEGPGTARGDIATGSIFRLFQQHIRAELEQIGFGDRRGTIKLTVTDFAERMATTPYLLNAACKAVAGVSARTFLQDAIIAQAGRLLLYTDLSIKEIAYMLGYSHASHFIRFFKQMRELTPSEFRRLRQVAG